MYGPPACRKRKMRVAVWSAQMYSAFVGVQALGQDGMHCAPFPITYSVLKDFFRLRFGERRVRPLCHLMVRQQTWQSSRLRSRRWFADVGIAQRFPSLSLGRRHLQTGHVGQYGRPIGISAGEYGPCHAGQFVGQGDTDDVAVAAR